MAKASPPVPVTDRHSAFRARAQESLKQWKINGRVVLVSTLLAPVNSGQAAAHGTNTGYNEYLCRCSDCSEAYSRYRKGRREENLGHRERVGDLMVSTLLGTPGYPAHGVVTGTYWYGCECEKCRKSKRDIRQGISASGKKPADVRAENLTHLVPRSSDGVLVSTLLGTEGYPDHGTYSGADWFGCWCEPCRWAKNTLARLRYVLSRNWPGDAPRGVPSALSREILALWSGSLSAAREQIEQLLNEHPEWTDTDATEDMADRLAAALGGKTEEAA